MEIETKLAKLTADQLWTCALYIQAVATAAATAEERAVVNRLAHRFRVLAMEKSAALSLLAPALSSPETLSQRPTADLPSSLALQTATEVLRRGHHLRETMQHPVVVGQAIELGYLLSAYCVAPTVGRVAPLLNRRTTP